MFDIPQDVRIERGEKGAKAVNALLTPQQLKERGKAGGLASSANKDELGKSINAQKGAKIANEKSHQIKNADGKSLKAIKMMEASLATISTPITLVKVDTGEILHYRSKRETVKETPLSQRDLSKLLSHKEAETKGYTLK